MRKRILIVEDEFIEAHNLQRILEQAGYEVCGTARSVVLAMEILKEVKPDLVLLDIMLKGRETGIDLAWHLKKQGIAFIYLSANSNKDILLEAKKTEPYGFLVKPFREKDVLVTLDIANYLHEQKQKLRVREPSPLVQGFVDIIGDSPKLKTVLSHVSLVAPTNTSVLVLGESGTGKERIADAVHANSPRSTGPLIKVNCAALPISLIESELFGHEKGAFTGASERRIGKFEQAEGGTIFLDEIGEMPPDLQVKLLRVLQEKEIERIGGKGTIRVNVRIVAATNRNLEKEVAEGRFRLDLYYRLNVFPIVVPPLRERKEDIPVLADHFLKYYSGLMEKPAPGLSADAMATLQSYHWPGNVRELQHLLERNVLLAQDNRINQVVLPAMYTTSAPVPPDGGKIKTMEENEIEHILDVLKICNGKLSGPGGAAEILDLPYSTLASRIKKLGIKRENSFK